MTSGARVILPGESKKVTLLRLLHIFTLVATLLRQKLIQLFALSLSQKGLA